MTKVTFSFEVEAVTGGEGACIGDHDWRVQPAWVVILPIARLPCCEPCYRRLFA